MTLYVAAHGSPPSRHGVSALVSGRLRLAHGIAQESHAARGELDHIPLAIVRTSLHDLGAADGSGDPDDRAPGRPTRSPTRRPRQTGFGDAPGCAEALAHRLGNGS